MSDFLKTFIKESGNQFASLVDDGLEGSDVKSYVDTGCYILNGLVSGDIFKGFPDNKIIALAGEQATGKTYITMGMISKFLNDNPEAVVLYFDSEQAVTSDMFRSRGIDPKRVAVFPVSTVEEFRRQAITIVDKYLEMPVEKRKKTMMVLDSLGMLSTSKEMNDTAEGKEVRDMTRAQVIKSTFRVLTVKLGVAHIPMIFTNHTYDVVGAYVPTKEMGGGAGLKYAASIIVYLSKKKDKNADGEVVGNIIHCRLNKGRFTKENKMVDVRLNYETGLDPYYGLIDLAVEHGILSKTAGRVELPNGSKIFEKQMYETPEKYFTEELLNKINEAAVKEFCYGTSETEEDNKDNE
jgi:RecA/RadA recombinase